MDASAEASSKPTAAYRYAAARGGRFTIAALAATKTPPAATQSARPVASRPASIASAPVPAASGARYAPGERRLDGGPQGAIALVGERMFQGVLDVTTGWLHFP